MRVTGGELRGRVVHMPPGVTRPAMDRMRVSLFSILGSLGEQSFLDLFSGSGLVAIEAWSRGARPVVLVERERIKRSVILRNLTDLSPKPIVRIEPVERFIARNARAFDIVYLDPPFAYPHKRDLLQRLGRSRSIHAGTRIVMHAPRAEVFSSTAHLIQTDRREYGGSVLTFFEPADRPVEGKAGTD